MNGSYDVTVLLVAVFILFGLIFIITAASGAMWGSCPGTGLDYRPSDDMSRSSDKLLHILVLI